MDLWSPEHRRNNKRSFSEMSEVLNPQNNQYQFAQHSQHERVYNPLPSPSQAFPSPHQSLHNNQALPRANMANRPLPMPSLHHQASNSIIDLTEDDVPSSQGRRSSQRAGAPPQLARSDSITLGAEVIEIDDSDDDEVEFLRETRLPPPPPQPRPRSVHHPVAYRNQLPPPNVRPDNRNDMMAAFREVQRNIGLMNQGNNVGALFGHRHLNNIGNNIRGLFGEIRPPGDNIPMRMPGNMDYHLHPFQEPAQQAKDEHVPPPPAREGFTRSPKEDDICVCPACDEELVFHPDQVESTSAVKPSSKKAPSKADRAEHPFWVVRECGHLYCNSCYQNRGPRSKPALFPVEKRGNKKTTVCAVDDCQSDVGDKKHWVGVFL